MYTEYMENGIDYEALWDELNKWEEENEEA